MAKRVMITVIRKKMQTAKMGALLITDRANLRYLTSTCHFPQAEELLTGFTGSGIALITAHSQFLLTDSRYVEQAEEEVSGWEIILSKKSLYRELIKIITKTRIRSVGIEENSISFAKFRKLDSCLGNVKMIPVKDWVQKCRAVKSEMEIELITGAAEIIDETFTYAFGIIKPGMTERKIAAKLEYFIKAKKSADTSFDIILLSGFRSSLPHGKPSSKILQKGEIVLLDAGVNYRGYCSDLTRTVCLGRMNSEQRKVYRVVKKAQEKALANIKPGIKGSRLNSLAGSLIKRAGYVLGHSLGHGVGLEIHESPGLRAGSRDIIKENMVFTVEPGIYLKGKFGIRIEDMVLVKKDGIELLTHSPDNIIEL